MSTVIARNVEHGQSQSVPTIDIHPVMVGTAHVRLCPPYTLLECFLERMVRGSNPRVTMRRKRGVCVIPGRAEGASFDVQLHIRKSITTIGSIDSGQPRAAASGMTALNPPRTKREILRPSGALENGQARDSRDHARLYQVSEWRRKPLVAISLNEFGHVFAVAGRRMPRAAMRAVVVAHAGPFIGPYPLAACASVDVEKPGHGQIP